MAERAIWWSFFSVKPAFLKVVSAQFSMVMGAKYTWYCFLFLRFLSIIVGRFVCDNPPVIYGGYFQVIEVDGVISIWGIEKVILYFQIAWAMDAGSNGRVQGPGHSRLVLSCRIFLLFCIGVFDCKLQLRVWWFERAKRGRCCVGVVTGVWWGALWSVQVLQLELYWERVPLPGGSSYCCAFLCMLWVSTWVVRVARGAVWGSCCVRCAPWVIGVSKWLTLGRN